MASSTFVELLNKSYSSDVTNEKGDSKFMSPKSSDFIFQIAVSNRTAGSITAIIEHSLDGENWYTLVSFTAAIATNTAEVKYPATSIGGYLRSSVTTAVGTSLDAKIIAAYSAIK